MVRYMNKSERLRFKKASTTVPKLAAKVARIDARTKVEYKKLYNRTTTPSYIDWTGGINVLSAVPSAIDDNSKIGNELRAINLSLRWSLRSGTSPSRVRVIVLRDYQNKLTTPVEWLRYAGTITCVDSPREDEFLHYGKTLMDKVYNLSADANPLVGGSKVIKINKTLQYESGTSVNIVNPIKILVIGDADDGAATATKPTITFVATLSYTDN